MSKIDDMDEYRRDTRERIVPINPGWGGKYYYYYPTKTLPEHVLSRVRSTPHIAYQKVYFHMRKYLLEKELQLEKENPTKYRINQHIDNFRHIVPFILLPFTTFHFIYYPATVGPYVVALSCILNKYRRPLPENNELLFNGIGNIDDVDFKEKVKKNLQMYAKWDIFQSILSGAAVLYGFHFLFIRIESMSYINMEYYFKNRKFFDLVTKKFWRETHPKSVSVPTVVLALSFGVLDYFYRSWPTKILLDNFDDVYKE